MQTARSGRMSGDARRTLTRRDADGTSSTPLPVLDRPILSLEPPYRSLKLIPAPGPRDVAQLPAGSVLLLALSGRHGEPAAADVLSRLRLCFPAAGFAALVRPAACQDALRLAREAGTLRLRAVLIEGEPFYEPLRAVLTDPSDLHDQVADWLSLRELPLSPYVRYLIREIFHLSPRHPQILPLLGEIGESARGVRGRFRKKRLPPPQKWHQVARATHAALRIQAEPDRTLLSVALELGYSSEAALSRQLYSVFGVRSGKLRRTVGWAWLLDRWRRRLDLCSTVPANKVR